MDTHRALPMQTPAGNCFSNLRVSSSLPILPTDSEDKSNLSDPFHVSLEREIVTNPFPANAHPFIHRSGSVTHTCPSASGFPTDIHFSFSPPERPSHDPAFISQSASEGASLPTHHSSGSAAGFITYPKEDDDNSWSTDQLQRLLDFPDHVPASCSRVERISGLILSEEHTKRTDWQDLAEQLLDDDPTDPTWSNFLADSSVADQQSKVPQSSSNISVHQPQIQQHHPLPSRDMTNVANPVSNAPLNKPRMRWTPELHEAFIEAVNQLGGGERATPKGILMVMNVEGLTIYQVKSHLQKYRTARFKPEVSEGSSDRRNTCGHVASLDWKMSMDITEALRLQMEVQKQLHEQLEIQRKLQLQIEEQGKCLLQMLENQNKLEQEKSVASSFPAPISISNAIDSVKSEGSELDHLKVGAPGENSHSLKGKKKMPESVTRDDHHPDASGGPGSPSMKRARIDEAN